jgi:hypothetical protein
MLIELALALLIGILCGVATGFAHTMLRQKQQFSKNTYKKLTRIKSKINKTTPIRAKARNRGDRVNH